MLRQKPIHWIRWSEEPSHFGNQLYDPSHNIRCEILNYHFWKVRFQLFCVIWTNYRHLQTSTKMINRFPTGMKYFWNSKIDWAIENETFWLKIARQISIFHPEIQNSTMSKTRCFCWIIMISEQIKLLHFPRIRMMCAL